jgi:hypothetical protein
LRLRNIYPAIIALISIISTTLNAQSSFSLSASGDLVSRYIWRGLEINGSPNIQPAVEGSIAGFAAGFWGSYAFAERTTSDEIDFYAGYTFSTKSAGDFGLLYTDYYYPTGNRFSDYSDSSAHFLEAAVTYSGPSSLPISIFLGYTFKPSNLKALYWEVGYSASIDAFGFDIFVGGTDGREGGYYGTTEFAVINTGFKASQDVNIGESLIMPLFVSFIVNPDAETIYLVFGVGLKI